jgi:hypothetical protein
MYSIINMSPCQRYTILPLHYEYDIENVLNTEHYNLVFSTQHNLNENRKQFSNADQIRISNVNASLEHWLRFHRQ